MNREYISYLVELNNANALRRLIHFEKETPGFDINTCDTHGATLLHLAAKLNNMDMVQVLIDLGCNVDIVDADGKTCWEYCAHHQHEQQAAAIHVKTVEKKKSLPQILSEKLKKAVEEKQQHDSASLSPTTSSESIQSTKTKRRSNTVVSKILSIFE